MSQIERHLTDSLHDVAAEVTDDGVPPLDLHPARYGLNGHSRLSFSQRSARWLAPAAASVAVVAIAVSIAAIASQRHGSVGRDQGAQTRKGTSSTVIPRYYIAETGTKVSYADRNQIAGIYVTGTGKLVAAIPAPATGQNLVDVSAAADDRTFAIATQINLYQTLPATTFYLIRFNPATRAWRTTPLAMPAVPANASFDAFALSPDGSKLAVAFEPNGNDPHLSEEIRVLNIGTGAVRTWTSSRGSVAGDTADPSSLSWADNDVTLAFNWYSADKHNPQQLALTSGIRLLNTGAPGADIVADSRLSLRIIGHNGEHAIATAIAALSDIASVVPDGNKIVAALTALSGPYAGFGEFSAATGRMQRLLDWKPTRGQQVGGPTDVLWSNASGSVLIVYAPPGHWNRIGILRGNRLTLLPNPEKVDFPRAAW
jgi:hypothetical protein